MISVSRGYGYHKKKALIYSEVFGLAGSASALVGECITVDIFQRTGGRGVAGAAVFFLFSHILLFGLSFDATSYVYSAEILPNPVRARGLGISATGMFVSTIIFLQCAPTTLTISAGSIIFFSSPCVQSFSSPCGFLFQRYVVIPYWKHYLWQ